jgi:hypothetical protein
VEYRKQSACLGIVFAVLAACGVKDPQTGKPGNLTPRESLLVTRKLAQIAGQANQASPVDVDADTRLDGAQAGPGLKLTSRYTLVNSRSQGLDTTVFQRKLTPAIKEASCDNSELRPLIDQGVVVVLEYRGADGNPLGVISLNRDSCSAIH